MGDLHAKIVEFGGKSTNKNGESLTDLTESTSLMIINNKTHTHQNFINFDSVILDWILIESKLIEFFKTFGVLEQDDMGSDHLPIMAKFATTVKRKTNLDSNNCKKNYNYSKANWLNYAKDLEPINFKNIN